MARGLDVFELTPGKFLTQNEIDAAKSVRVSELNVQSQEKIEWSQKLIVAKAYVDQLERAETLPANRIAELRQAIQSAENSKLSKKDAKKLKSIASTLEKNVRSSKSELDVTRLQTLAKVLKQPIL